MKKPLKPDRCLLPGEAYPGQRKKLKKRDEQIYKERISDGTTYLSINAPNVLLSGCLLQAALFMKLDQTEVGTYKQNYDKEMMQFKVWAEGRNTKEEMRHDKLLIIS